jgi:putative endonuclease
MSVTETTRKADAAARAYLEMRGFRVLEQHWRRPEGQIDAIAEKAGIKYFVEIIYNEHAQAADALYNLNATNLRRKRSVAESWIEESKWNGPTRSATIEMSSQNFTIMHFIEDSL